MPSSDKLSLRLTCKTLNAYVSPILFEALRLVLECDLADKRFCEFLRIAAKSPTEFTIARFVRRIQLVSLRPNYIRHKPLPSTKKFMTAKEEKCVDNKDAVYYRDQKITYRKKTVIGRRLVPFVKKMVNVNSLT